jgi:very-short-patch-repair endonuclease
VGGVKFRRQFSVGNYMLDFYAPQYALGIEADGGQHYTDYPLPPRVEEATNRK